MQVVQCRQLLPVRKELQPQPFSRFLPFSARLQSLLLAILHFHILWCAHCTSCGIRGRRLQLALTAPAMQIIERGSAACANDAMGSNSARLGQWHAYALSLCSRFPHESVQPAQRYDFWCAFMSFQMSLRMKDESMDRVRKLCEDSWSLE